MYAQIRGPGERPTFELEPTEHSMSQEYYHGIYGRTAEGDHDTTAERGSLKGGLLSRLI